MYERIAPRLLEQKVECTHAPAEKIDAQNTAPENQIVLLFRPPLLATMLAHIFVSSLFFNKPQ